VGDRRAVRAVTRAIVYLAAQQGADGVEDLTIGATRARLHGGDVDVRTIGWDSSAPPGLEAITALADDVARARPDQVAIVGHASPDGLVLASEPGLGRAARLTHERATWAPLERWRSAAGEGAIAGPGFVLQLLGCGLGRAPGAERGAFDGALMALALARRLACTVRYALDGLVPEDFGPSGFTPRPGTRAATVHGFLDATLPAPTSARLGFDWSSTPAFALLPPAPCPPTLALRVTPRGTTSPTWAAVAAQVEVEVEVETIDAREAPGLEVVPDAPELLVRMASGVEVVPHAEGALLAARGVCLVVGPSSRAALGRAIAEVRARCAAAPRA
jgi:hypothetical protein